jgi:hypothetical protein
MLVKVGSLLAETMTVEIDMKAGQDIEVEVECPRSAVKCMPCSKDLGSKSGVDTVV